MLRYVVDNIPHCIFWKDADSRSLDGTHSVAGLRAQSERREPTNEVADAARGALIPATLQPHQRLIADREFGERELEDRESRDREASDRLPLSGREVMLRDDQGRELVILTTQVPLRNEAGDVVGRLGIVVDTERRKQVERDLERAKEQAERALQLENESLANIRRELHIPLSLVCSPLASLLAGDSGSLPGVISSQIERAHRNALRLLGMVDDLLDAARLDAARLENKKRETLRDFVDVRELIGQIVDDAQPLAGSGSLSLDFESSLGHELVPVDRRMLERLVLNLLGNALEVTLPGGSVRLGVRRQSACLELSVDTVNGVDAAACARALLRFEDQHPAAARRYGMGLGLALVKEFSELMGGAVEVQSERGKGARVIVRLPLSPAANTLRVAMAPSAPERWTPSLLIASPDTLRTGEAGSSSGAAQPRAALPGRGAGLPSGSPSAARSSAL